MSQEAKNINPESEDLFTTQDLLMEKPITEQEADNMDLISEDLEANPTEDEFMTEVETEAELLGDIAEDDEEVDQPTENDVEAIQADAEQTEANQETTEGAKAKPLKVNRISELPLSKVKHIIKLDPEVKLVNSEAVFLVTKATESFIRTLARESLTHAAQQKKKTITKAHVDQALTILPVEL